MPKCINCSKVFEDKEGFTVTEGYDTGICVACQDKLEKRETNKIIKKEYREVI